MTRERPIPLDLAATQYSYVERPNSALLELVGRWVLEGRPTPRILDVGCGAGANARELRRLCPNAVLIGVEPNARAAELAREVCDEVYEGTVQSWLAGQKGTSFDGVILSDVLEHMSDPVALLQELGQAEPLARARFVISVPNYGVWYNRLKTLAGRFEYGWSGLYDRTHLRFFTRRSLRRLLGYCGYRVLADRPTPSLVQSTAPVLRKLFERDVESGNHLSLGESPAFRLYRRFVEPVESGVCRLWPELLGFQIVCVAEPEPRPGGAA